MSALAKIKEAFEAEAAKRHAAGLPRGQAEFAACLQIVRDVKNGLLDPEGAREFIIEQEIAQGRTREAAEAHADQVFAGQPGSWAPRDYGYERGCVRNLQPKRGREGFKPEPSGLDQIASDQLSALANQWWASQGAGATK